MDRRLYGALLFAVTVTLAVVIPALGGVRLAGIGTPTPFPADPKVGDCLLESLNEVILTPPATASSTLGPSFVPCDGRDVGGEVVAIARATGDVRTRIVRAEDSGVDCYHSSLEYSGLVPSNGRYLLAGHSSSQAVDWNLTINARTAWVVPAPLLRTAGRDWVACVAAPLNGGTFHGRLAEAFNGGKLPDGFGFCWAQNTPSAKGAVACGGRHLAELVSLGTIPNGAGITLADIKNSCKRLAAQVIGRSDPTAAGELAVGTSVSPDAARSSGPAEPLHVICYFEPLKRALFGSLIGLRDRPIPYSK